MNTKSSGITLIELMIVVAIVGILAAIAYPSYRDQVIRSGRTEGKAALEQRAQALEKCFTRYMRYDDGNCAAAQATADGATPEGRYNVAIGNRTATTYTLTATPAGTQATDNACGWLSINEQGIRASQNGVATVCW